MSAETEKVSGVVREKPIPEAKKELVKELVDKISNNRTVLIASCKGLPGEQFHEIKKKLRGKAEIKVTRKSAIYRAIDEIEKGAVKNLKEKVGADIVILFSDMDPFELSALLSDNQSPAKARAGDIAPDDINIESGPTDLIPGPAISELSGVGLKVAVKEGKLEIMKGALVAKKGEKISAAIAGVLAKLNIKPMKVGFIPLAAYDSKEDKYFIDIAIDKKGTLETLRDLIGKALSFSLNIGYPTKETIIYLIAKAANEEKVLSKLVGEKAEKPAGEEDKEEEKIEESEKEKKEEVKEEVYKDYFSYQLTSNL